MRRLCVFFLPLLLAALLFSGILFALLALLFRMFSFVRQSVTVFLKTLLGGIQ